MANGKILAPKEVSGYLGPNVTDTSTAKDVCDNVPKDRFIVWNKYTAPTYAPVNKNGYWTFRLYLHGSNSANYILFEAFYLNSGEYYFYSYLQNKWYKVTTAAV